MTSLHRTVRREIPANRLVIELTTEGIVMREKGRRKRFGPLSYGQLYLEIVRREVDAARRAKEKARKERRAARRK